MMPLYVSLILVCLFNILLQTLLVVLQADLNSTSYSSLTNGGMEVDLSFIQCHCEVWEHTADSIFETYIDFSASSNSEHF